MTRRARTRNPTNSAIGTSVNDQDYLVPFRFTGKINKLMYSLAGVLEGEK